MAMLLSQWCAIVLAIADLAITKPVGDPAAGHAVAGRGALGVGRAVNRQPPGDLPRGSLARWREGVPRRHGSPSPSVAAPIPSLAEAWVYRIDDGGVGVV